MSGFFETRSPIDHGYYQASFGEAFRSVTPSFLYEEEDVMDACFPSLTFKQRVFGLGCCIAIGLLLQITSFGAFASALLGHPSRFALRYTFGNIVSLMGTCFLAGPKSQIRNMSRSGRRTTSAIFLGSMVLTVLAVESGQHHGRALLIMLLVFAQWFALIWYTLSYVPYGQKIGKKIVRKAGSWCCDF